MTHPGEPLPDDSLMAAVSLRNIVKSYAGRLVLDDITLDLHKGEKVGLIGANGSGKTTLFKIVAGMESPDSGSVTRARDLNIAYLPQTPDMVDTDRLIDVASAPFETHRELEAELQALATRIAEATGAPEEATLLERYDRLHARFESLGGYSYEIRIREVLGGLGFAPMEYDRPVGMLSGGQRCRAALARLLLAEGDLLLLDEPTNHLDIDATRWLETYLANYAGGAVIVSHDRYLLDRVVSKIIEIEDHHATVFPTDYTGYAETKRVRQLAAERAHAKQRAWITHQEDYIRRAGHRKDTAR
ncbi:MAG: ATP-binding cassette domain-containing protein, partial [Phycisphaerae bacterium]